MTTAVPQTDAGKAWHYAEKTLDVNGVYGAALATRQELSDLLEKLIDLRRQKRIVEGMIEDREWDIVSDERGKHPGMSATAMKEHLKEAYWKDGALRALREQLSTVGAEVEEVEASKRLAEHDVEIGCARMTELGGLLNFMAVVQQLKAQTQVVLADPSDPWQGSVPGRMGS